MRRYYVFRYKRHDGSFASVITSGINLTKDKADTRVREYLSSIGILIHSVDEIYEVDKGHERIKDI